MANKIQSDQVKCIRSFLDFLEDLRRIDSNKGYDLAQLFVDEMKLQKETWRVRQAGRASHQKLVASFVWDHSREGYYFWYKVNYNLMALEARKK